MKAIDLVLGVSKYAPEISMRSKMLSSLRSIRPDASEKKYAGASFILSLVAGFLTLIFALLIGESIAFSLLGFALCFVFLLALPGMELKKKAAEFEARLPLMLRTLGMLLDMKIPFQRALEIVAEDEPELQPVVDDVRKGITLQKSLSCIVLAYDSFMIKRAISQLITAYEVGSSGQEIRRMGDEMLSVQRHALREYASKSAIFGLLFIVSAAVLPTFFLVYSVLGQFSLGSAVPEALIAIVMLLVFPLISLAILLLAKSMLPRSALEGTGSAQDIAVLGPTAFIVLSLLVLPKAIAPIGIALGCAAAGFIVYRRYEEEKRMEEIDKHLPDALFALSGLPKSTSMEDMFNLIEKSGYGALSEEAGKSKKQLDSKLTIDLVLEDLGARNKSGMLNRACDMLGHVFSTNSFSQLNRLAEDMLQFVEVRRERAGLLAMQKYTLVFGGLIVPFILKITLNLLSSMSEFFSGTGASTQLDFAYTVIPAYLIIYALLSSFYIANIDERKSASAGYFIGIVVVSLGTFFFLNI